MKMKLGIKGTIKCLVCGKQLGGFLSEKIFIIFFAKKFGGSNYMYVSLPRLTQQPRSSRG